MSSSLKAPAGATANDRATIARIDSSIARLARRRKQTITKTGLFARSKLAWKVAAYQEAILYRLVMLANGTVLAWNADNVVTAFLASRALIETVAVLEDFEHRLLAAVAAHDLGNIDSLAMNRTFSTRDKEWLSTFPESEAVNVLSLIDQFDKRICHGLRQSYDMMSERCHPNSLGHHQMFSTLDTKTGTVTFSEQKNLFLSFQYVLGGLILMEFTESKMEKLDEIVGQIAGLQHQLHPVK